MQLKPDDLPPMLRGESRNVQFKLGGTVGINTIDEFAIEAKPPRLTFGTPSVTGSNVTVLVNADNAGDFVLTITAELSSSETVKGRVRLSVRDCESDPDY